jgi:NADPH:quinone reductase-like Zn-dependent oxidoreductase
MRKNVRIQLVYLANAPLEARRRAQADITRWLEEGERLHRFTTYPLEQTAAAHATVETGGKRGTVVVLVPG